MSGSNSSPPGAVGKRAESPLDLTVHSLPSLGQDDAQQASRTRVGRWKMLAVLLVCAAPVIASYFTYYVVRPEGRRNFGELIDPQRPVPLINATEALGTQPVPLPTLRGQWLLVSVGDASCDARCERHLYLQRQLRESLGKNKDRMDWVWLATGETPVREGLRPALTEATVLRVEASALAQWLVPAQGQTVADHLYVVDPQGNWMMRFPASMDAEGASKAKRDLERLMRASSSWDQAGRP
jgi:hypothetical protein